MSTPPTPKRVKEERGDNKYTLLSWAWHESKQSKTFEHFGRVVLTSLLEQKEGKPTEEELAEPNASFYVCLHPLRKMSSLKLDKESTAHSASVCGAWIAGSARNKGVLRHLSTVHNICETEPKESAAGASPVEMVKGVILSSLPLTPFTDAHGPLKTLGAVPQSMPSANTFRRIANELTLAVVGNLQEVVAGKTLSISFDGSPSHGKEYGVLNVHNWESDGPRSRTVALQQMGGSLTGDALQEWAEEVLSLYNLVPVSKHVGDELASPLGAGHCTPGLCVFSCTDGGGNAAKAGNALVDLPAERAPQKLPSLFTWSYCAAHMGNLTIKDALRHPAVASAYQRALAIVNKLRVSRAMSEKLSQFTNKRPPRAVDVRWRTALPVIDFVVANQENLELVSSELALTVDEATKLGVVRGVLEPLDILLAQAQSDVGGNAFFLYSRVCKAVGDIRKGVGRMLKPNSYELINLTAAAVADLSVWHAYVLERTKERFFSFDTTHFTDTEENADEDQDEDEDEFEVDPPVARMDADMGDGADDDDMGAGDDSAPTTVNRGRFRKFNFMMTASVLVAFALSPLKSAYELAVAFGAMDDKLRRTDDSRSGVHHVLALRYCIDLVWSREVDSPGPVASDGSGDLDPFAVMLMKSDGRVADPIGAAAKVITNFQQKPQLIDLFQKVRLKVQTHDPAGEREFMKSWVALADAEAPWLGAVLRAVLTAPLRSCKCESDFSLLQHVLAPRRTRLSRSMLAAYMLVKKNPDLAVITEKGTPNKSNKVVGPMDRMFKPKARAQVAAAVAAGGDAVVTIDAEPDADAAASTPGAVIAGSDSTAADDAPAAAVDRRAAGTPPSSRAAAAPPARELDVAPSDEPDMAWCEVRTRSGRIAKVARPVDVAARIMPTSVMDGRRRRNLADVVDDGDDDRVHGGQQGVAMV